MFSAVISAVKGFVKRTFVGKVVETVGTEVGFRIAITGVGVGILFYARRCADKLVELVNLNIEALKAVGVSQTDSFDPANA